MSLPAMFLKWCLPLLPCLALTAATGDETQRQSGLVTQQQQQQQQQHVLGYTERPAFRPHRFFLAPSSPQTGFAAFGDSYSAGIGTGVEGKEDDCRHGLHAHPQLIAVDLAASQGGGGGGPNATTAFQALSCTGATTEQVLSGGEESQIDAWDTTSRPADFALLSLGGNDLGFFAIMNACVFRFYSFYSGTCEEALEGARARIESGDFERRLELVILEILDKARWEKKPWFFITVTGYARFFNDVTDDCDDMSFGIWWWGGPKLTKSLRIQMNALVYLVNAKIKRTVDNVNSRFTKDKALFVDYDRAFDGHRFCEENVVEPDYSRNDTWFFLAGGPDNARNGTRPNSTVVETLPSTSALIDPSLCLEPAQKSGDWGELALCYMAMAKERSPWLRPAREDLVAQNSMWYVPTFYGKTFHPRSLGHEAIKDMIYEAWTKLDE